MIRSGNSATIKSSGLVRRRTVSLLLPLHHYILVATNRRSDDFRIAISHTHFAKYLSATAFYLLANCILFSGKRYSMKSLGRQPRYSSSLEGQLNILFSLQTSSVFAAEHYPRTTHCQSDSIAHMLTT